MALTINAYKNNTVSSVSGTTFTSNGTPFVAGDVGRYIVIDSGTAYGQRRLITGYVSTSVVTIGYALNVSPFRNFINAVTGLPFAEVLPSSGDAWVMSSYLADVADTTNINAIAGSSVYEFVGTNVITIADGAFLFDRNIALYTNSSYIALTPGGHYQFGDIDEDGNVYNGCHLIELSGDWSPNRSWTNTANGDAGDLHMFDCLITIVDGASGDGIFWSLFRGATASYRFVGCTFNGILGSRIQGSNCVLKDLLFTGQSTAPDWQTVGPYGTLGLIENVNFINKNRVFYWNHLYGGFVVRNISFTNIADALIYSTDGTAEDAIIIGFNADDVEALTYIVNVATAAGTSNITLKNPIVTSIVDSSLDPITDSYKRVIWNPSDTAVDIATVTDGDWDAYDATWWTMALGTTGNRTLANGTTTTPYVQAIISYEHEPNILVVTGREPSNAQFTGITDSGKTDTKAITDARTGSTTFDQLYDSSKSWTFDNYDDAFPTKGAKLINRSGEALVMNAIDLILDSDAVSAFAVSQTGDGSVTINTDTGANVTPVGFTEVISSGEQDEIIIAFPAGIQDDDLAYIDIIHAQSSENEWNTPSGWVIPTGLTEVQTGGTPASIPAVSTFRRVLSSDSGSVTITNVGTNTSGIVAQMSVWRGADTTTPEDALSTIATGASGDPDPAAITTVTDGAIVYTIAVMDDGEQTAPTSPTGYTDINNTATLDGAGTGE